MLSYQEGKRTGTMDGRVVAFEDGRRISNNFVDKMMDVTVDFVAAPAGEGTTLTHTIDIAPKGFGKLFSPLIKRSLPEQTNESMQALKALAEG